MNYIENKTQEERVLELLKNAKGKRVALPRIIRLGIAQYNARIWGLRKKGYNIENKIKILKKGGKNKKHTFFKLVSIFNKKHYEI